LLACQKSLGIKGWRSTSGQFHAVHGGQPFCTKALGQQGLLTQGMGFKVLRQAFTA
jgi:hypothetical protein